MTKEIEFKEPDEFLCFFIKSRIFSDKSKKYIFRGEALEDSSQEIPPSAFRKFKQRMTNREKINDEFYLIKKFVNILSSNGYFIDADVFNKIRKNFENMDTNIGIGHLIQPPEELFNIISLAQHYGIQTRFIDWTRSPFVASYFAAIKTALNNVKGKRKKNGDHKKIIVHALNKRTRPLNKINYFYKLSINTYKNSPTQLDNIISYSIKDNNYMYNIIEPTYFINKNIQAQAGLFIACFQPNLIKNKHNNTKIDDYNQYFSPISLNKYLEENGLNSSSDDFIKISLSCEKSVELIEILDSTFNCNASTLFPSLEGCVKYAADFLTLEGAIS